MPIEPGSHAKTANSAFLSHCFVSIGIVHNSA